MALRKTEKKASTISGGVFELPQAYTNFLGKDSGPVMFVAEPESWVLSVVFLNDDSQLHKVTIDLPDRPGAVHEIMRVMGDLSINVLSGWTNVLVYYEKMKAELVIDVRSSKVKDASGLKSALSEKVSALGPQFSLTEVLPIAL
jgi:predicted amino acid-binding ACT domain protein